MTAPISVRVTALDARQRWFGLDALVTAVNALGYLSLAGWLSEHLGATPSTYRAIGAALLLFAISVGVYATIDHPPRWAGWSIVAINAAWVVGSLLVAVTGLGDFDGLGRWWIACQAAVVAVLTVMQAATIREG